METRYTFFVLLRATAAWLRLSRSDRNAIFTGEVGQIFALHPDVSVRYYDAEAFTARCSDVAVFETAEPRHYYFLMERIRDSSLITVPYFEIVDIIPAIEGGFREFEAASGVMASD